MNGPRSVGPEYTGKHRRDGGPAILPTWAGRAGGYGRSMPAPDDRPVADSRPATDGRPGLVAVPVPGAAPAQGTWPETGQWPDA